MKQKTAKIALATALAGGGLFAITSTVGAKGVGVEKFKEMLVPTPTMLREGEEIYANQCSSCHGADGSGASTENYPAERFANPAPNLQKAEYRHGGGPVSVYNTITLGLDVETGAEAAKKEAEGEQQDADGQPDGQAAEAPAKVPYHPTYRDTLRYEERWAVTHYVRSLGPTEGLKDPDAVVAAAKERAIKGSCDPALKSTLQKRVEPPGKEAMNKAAEVFASQCATCHGKEGKGDGPAGGSLTPPPRNFHSSDEKWKKGTSPFAIFNVLSNGIQGTAMASFTGIDVDTRWALAHYVRRWVPKERRAEVTDDQIMEVCRTRSAPAPPESISLQQAEAALLADQRNQRWSKLALYPAPKVADDANPEDGRQVYEQQCAGCHGKDFAGKQLGPYGVRRAGAGQKLPKLEFKPRGLVREHAGGTYKDFAQRASAGAHATLPNMTAASMLTRQNWKDLHAYIASLEEEVELREIPAVEQLERVSIESSAKTDTKGSETNNDEAQKTDGAQNGSDSETTSDAPSAGDSAEEPAGANPAGGAEDADGTTSP